MVLQATWQVQPSDCGEKQLTYTWLCKSRRWVVLYHRDVGTAAGYLLRGVHRRKLSRWDDLLASGRTAPTEFKKSASFGVIILDLDVILLACQQSNAPSVLGIFLLFPLIDQKLSVDPETHSIADTDMEGIDLTVLRLHISGPTCTPIIGTKSRKRWLGAPIEVNLRINTRDSKTAEVLIVIVSSGQTPDFHWARCWCRYWRWR